jgi:hypothetical protein
MCVPWKNTRSSGLEMLKGCTNCFNLSLTPDVFGDYPRIGGKQWGVTNDKRHALASHS